ncbi:MAG: methylated-DNA--[protein]-cysteine S-methyltransferase [Eubacteriales bacterium]
MCILQYPARTAENRLFRYRGFFLSITDKPDSPNEPSELSERAYTEIQEYLAGERQTFDFEYELRGTLFQVSVWRALAGIPYGQTRTYRQIAETIGNPRACRAVGMALSRNSLMIVIPCHRVIGAGGSLVGYAGGIEIKRFLLELEGCVVNAKHQP